MIWIRSGSDGLPSPPVKGEPLALVSSGSLGSAASSKASLGFGSMAPAALGTLRRAAERAVESCCRGLLDELQEPHAERRGDVEETGGQVLLLGALGATFASGATCLCMQPGLRGWMHLNTRPLGIPLVTPCRSQACPRTASLEDAVLGGSRLRA